MCIGRRQRKAIAPWKWKTLPYTFLVFLFYDGGSEYVVTNCRVGFHSQWFLAKRKVDEIGDRIVFCCPRCLCVCELCCLINVCVCVLLFHHWCLFLLLIEKFESWTLANAIDCRLLKLSMILTICWYCNQNVISICQAQPWQLHSVGQIIGEGCVTHDIMHVHQAWHHYCVVYYFTWSNTWFAIGNNSGLSWGALVSFGGHHTVADFHMVHSKSGRSVWLRAV